MCWPISSLSLDGCCFVDFVAGVGSRYGRTIQAMPAQVTAIKLLQLVGVCWFGFEVRFAGVIIEHEDVLPYSLATRLWQS